MLLLCCNVGYCFLGVRKKLLFCLTAVTVCYGITSPLSDRPTHCSADLESSHVNT